MIRFNKVANRITRLNPETTISKVHCGRSFCPMNYFNKSWYPSFKTFTPVGSFKTKGLLVANKTESFASKLLAKLN